MGGKSVPQRPGLRYNLRMSIFNGAFTMLGAGIVGSYVPLYLLDGLHASNQDLALLNALPALIGVIGMIVGAFWVSRLHQLKPFAAATTLITRLTYILVAMAPAFGMTAAPLVVVVTIAGGNFPQALSGLAWQSLIAKLVPARFRADFFGQRNRVITAVGLAGTLLVGGALQMFPAYARRPYQGVFLLAVIMGLWEVWYLWRYHEPAPSPGPTMGPFVLRDLWNRRAYRRFVLVSAFFNLGWQLNWPLFNIFQIREAHATGLWIGLFAMVSQGGQILTYRWWGRASKRRCNLPMLALGSVGIGILPILAIIRRGLGHLVLVNFVGGLAVAGVNLLLFNQLLATVPKDRKPPYIAGYNICLGLIGVLAPELGVLFLKIFQMDGAMMISTGWCILGGCMFFMIEEDPRRRHRLLGKHCHPSSGRSDASSPLAYPRPPVDPMPSDPVEPRTSMGVWVGPILPKDEV